MVTDSEASEGDDQASVDMSAQDLEGEPSNSINKSSKAMFNMESSKKNNSENKDEFQDDKLKKEDSTIKVTGQLSSGR